MHRLFSSIALCLAVSACTARKPAISVGTGESIGGGGNYATIMQKISKEADFGLSLIANNAISGSFCAESGIDASHVATVEALLRANAAQVRIALAALKFTVTPDSLTVEDPQHALHPVRAKLLPSGEVLLHQGDVDAGAGRQLVVHEAFHASISGPFPDFIQVPTYATSDGGQRELDDAGLCVQKLVDKYYPYAAATDLTFRGGSAINFTDEHTRTVTLDASGNVYWATSSIIATDVPSYPRFQSRVRKFSPGGVQDAMFGDVPVPEPAGATRGGRSIFNITVQADGKVLVAGTEAQYGMVNRYFFYRILASGQPDTSFNTTVENDLAGFASYYTGMNGNALVLQGDKIVAGGYRCDSSACLFMLLRLLPDGHRDTTFGTDGFAYASVGTFAQINCLVSTIDGGFFAVGSSWDNNTNPVYRFGWAKFDANGALQNRGYETFTGTTSQQPVTATVQADGKVVVGGFAQNASGMNFALMRFDTDSKLDPTFGNGGRQVVTFPNGTGLISSLAIQSDGKIIGAGGITGTAGSELGIFRLTSDGSVDDTFRRADQTGVIHFLVAPNTSVALLARTADGKILVAGDDNTAGTSSAFLTRLYGEQEL